MTNSKDPAWLNLLLLAATFLTLCLLLLNGYRGWKEDRALHYSDRSGIFLPVHFHQTVEAHGPMGWKAPAKERKVKNPVPNSPESRSRGQNIYKDKCASCHGIGGDGQGEMGRALDPHPSNFTDRHMMKQMTDGEIFWKITTGKGPMPSYQKELTEKERWDLVNYIKSFAREK